MNTIAAIIVLSVYALVTIFSGWFPRHVTPPLQSEPERELSE